MQIGGRWSAESVRREAAQAEIWLLADPEMQWKAESGYSSSALPAMQRPGGNWKFITGVAGGWSMRRKPDGSKLAGDGGRNRR